MAEENQLAIRGPEVSFENMEKLAVSAAASGMFGITKKEQALCLFAICQAEGMHPIQALRRYHLIDGKPAMRADAMQGEFMAKGGSIIWHVRTDDAVAATLFADKSMVDDAARNRAVQRFDLLWKLESSDDQAEISETITEIAKLSREGEETLIRTYADAEDKGLTWSWKKNDKTQEFEQKDKANWKQSPRQMLTARVITEGVRLVAPGLIAGIYTPDEVEDIVHAEARDKAEFIRTALEAPDPRDKVAIQAMIDQYVEEAKTAKPAEKSRLLGLASELRVKLHDLELEEDEIPGLKPVGQPCAFKVGKTTCGYTAEQHADGKLGHDFQAPEAGELPATAEPELKLHGEPPPAKIPWKDYQLQHVKQKSLRGKKLGDFSKAEIKVIYEKTAHALTSEDDRIRTEATYIKEAFDAHEAGQVEEKK